MLFGKLLGKRATGDKKHRALVQSLHGLPVKYVTERRLDNEDVIGRGGHLTVKGEELLVDSSGEVLFRADIKALEASFLMSGDGVILHGPNKQDADRERTITVHFVYYRR